MEFYYIHHRRLISAESSDDDECAQDASQVRYAPTTAATWAASRGAVLFERAVKVCSVNRSQSATSALRFFGARRCCTALGDNKFSSGSYSSRTSKNNYLRDSAVV